MVAESNPARRHHRRPQRATDAAEPRTSSGTQSGNSTLSPRGRRRRGALVGLAAAAAVAVVAAPLAANAGAGLEPEFPFVSVHETGVSLTSFASSNEGGTAAPQERAGQAATTDEGGIAVHVAPTIATTLTPGAPVTVTVEIENATAESLAAATVRLTRSTEAIDEVAEIDAWVAATADAEAGTSGAAELVLGEAEARSLSAGSVTSVSFTLPPSSLDGVTESPIIGLGAELLVDGAVVAAGADVFANANAPAGAPFSLALAYPLTVPADATGLLDAEQLQTWTSPLGLLSRQLDAVAGRSVAIAVDPRIIASIRALGTAAPATATAWLDRLRGVPNEVFPLAYADSDLAIQAQLGLSGILSPTSFSDAMDPADFTGDGDEGDGDQGAGEGGAQGEGGDGGGTDGDGDTDVTAEPSPPPGEVPTTEALLDWPYTRSDLAWPADGTVAAGDLEFLDAAGLTTTILAPGNVEPGAEGANAASTINGSSAVVSHERLTEPLRAASVAVTDTEWRSATGRLVAELALGAGERTEPTTVLATFDRGTGVQASRVSATIDELATISWAQPVGLSAAIGAPPADRTLTSLPESDPRRSNIDRMVRTETEIAAFATVLADDRLLSGPTRRDLLALLDVSWIDEEEAWRGAVGDWLLAQRDTLGAVTVVPSSPINVVSSETGVPTTVLNALPYPVTIVVDVDPSNGRLIVGDRVEATIEAESRSTVRVPVAAGVGSGEVSLAVSLSSPTGVPIGTPVLIPANVQADWEGLGAAVLGIVVVLVFGIGIWRNISRRRRQRAASAQSDVAGAAATDAGADSATDAGATGVGADASDASMPRAVSDSGDTASRPGETTGAPASEPRND